MPAESKQEEPPDSIRSAISSRSDIEECIKAAVCALYKLNRGVQLNGEQRVIGQLCDYLDNMFTKIGERYVPHHSRCIDHLLFVTSQIYNKGLPLEGQAFPEKVASLSNRLKNMQAMTPEERIKYAEALEQFSRNFAMREDGRRTY
ncbi:MAG: hypothetical protein AABX12_01585 [Nanoarchaeota archaeon]